MTWKFACDCFMTWILHVSKKNSNRMMLIIVVGQMFGHVQLFATPWTAAHQASLSFTIFWSLFKLISTELVMLITVDSWLHCRHVFCLSWTHLDGKFTKKKLLPLVLFTWALKILLTEWRQSIEKIAASFWWHNFSHHENFWTIIENSRNNTSLIKTRIARKIYT